MITVLQKKKKKTTMITDTLMYDAYKGQINDHLI